MDSCLSHWWRGGGWGLNAPSSEILLLLLLKHNNCLAGMEKTDCFCYRYSDSSLSDKKSIRIKFVFTQQLQNNISLTFYIYNNDLPKIMYFDTYWQIKW